MLLWQLWDYDKLYWDGIPDEVVYAAVFLFHCHLPVICTLWYCTAGRSSRYSFELYMFFIFDQHIDLHWLFWDEMLPALNFSSKWNLLPNRQWILRSYPWPYIRFWICRQKRCKNDHDYESFIIVTVICLRLWCRFSIKQSWNCVNENQSLTYELPPVGGVTDFLRLCCIACQQSV